MTDVTGFGLLGHLLEMCRGAQLSAGVSMAAVPLIAGVLETAQAGMVTGASGRNWAAYGHDVQLAAGISPAQQALLTDPQTSGGLLVACSPEAASEVLALFCTHGFKRAATIGRFEAGPAAVRIHP
jgi:selenide,water dikinase